MLCVIFPKTIVNLSAFPWFFNFRYDSCVCGFTMHLTTLQFQSLVQLAAFMESVELMNFEINYNSLTVSSALEQEVVRRALHYFKATILEPEVLG